MTPVLAVINELSQQTDYLTVRFVCDRAFESQSRGLMAHAVVPVEVSVIHAGKLRRYHGESWRQRLRDVKTIVLNLRDVIFIGIGFVQSLWLLLRFRPDVVFAKGGFVCLPVGLAARLLGKKLVIHDSDTRPGLTNRVLARWSTAIATGSPLDNYRYPTERSRYVGVPIDPACQPVSSNQQRQLKADLGMIDIEAPLLVVTGGGLGAKSINDAMVRLHEEILSLGLHVYHVTGKKNYDSVRAAIPEHPHYQIVPFVYKDMVNVLAAGDIVISRGSATFLQELAGLAKATICVPATHLGDQVKNAQTYKTAGAVIVLSDRNITHSDQLLDELNNLLASADRRHQLASRLHSFARPNAARDVARMIQRVYEGKPL